MSGTYRDPPLAVGLADPRTTQAFNDLRQQLINLARDLRYRDATVSLPDTIATTIRHGLGRPMLGYSFTAPTSAVSTGRIVESNRTNDGMTLTATGYGATVTIDVRFW